MINYGNMAYGCGISVLEISASPQKLDRKQSEAKPPPRHSRIPQHRVLGVCCEDPLGDASRGDLKAMM